MEAARPATAEDIPRVVLLCRQALAEIGGQERGGDLFTAREARQEPVEASLAACLADPEAVIVVGTYDGTIIGYGTGRVETLNDGRHLGVLDDIFVEEGARGVGVGEAVMDLLLPWFRERGCVGVDATALPGLRATKNFYEESGFTARLIVMHHRMGA